MNTTENRQAVHVKSKNIELTTLSGLCIQLFAKLNVFKGSRTVHLGGLYIILTKGKAFKFLQDKDIPFGYNDAKFQASILNH